MLLTFKQWNTFLSNLSKGVDESWLVPLDTRHKKVARHFETDYTDCQGSKDLGSPAIAKWVSVCVLGDLTSPDDSVKLADLLDVTALVELENGETLSDSEALGGLGTFAPSVSAPEKQRVKDEHIDFRVHGYGEKTDA